MKIIWSNKAKSDIKEIYHYYLEVAGLKIAQSIKSKLIIKTLTLRQHPEMGQREENPLVIDKGFRYLVEGSYKIVYKYYASGKEILIATVFDTRQDPKKIVE